MKFGLHLGTRGAAMDPAGLITIAKRAEELGFGHLGLSDHVVLTEHVTTPYPYTKNRKWFAQDTGECLDQLTALSFVAAATTDIRLLTSVMVLPHRHPILSAKMLATIDHLSGGRLTVGVGAGWMREEIELLGAPSYERRGQLSDEYIGAFRALWSQERPAFEGDFIEFSDVLFAPKPVQQPGPPIWIGGEARPARRRAGVLGDGWYPVGNNAIAPFDTVDRYESGLAEVRRFAEDAARDPSALETGLYVIWYRLGEEELVDGRRRPFTGSAASIVEDVGRYGEAGLENLVIGFETNELSVALDNIEQFADAVMSQV